MPLVIVSAHCMFDVPNPTTPLPTRLAKITLLWVLKEFRNVRTGLGQFAKPVSFSTETPVHEAIHRQHAKIKEQLAQNGKRREDVPKI